MLKHYSFIQTIESVTSLPSAEKKKKYVSKFLLNLDKTMYSVISGLSSYFSLKVKKILIVFISYSLA